jgi:hypothetical protein
MFLCRMNYRFQGSSLQLMESGYSAIQDTKSATSDVILAHSSVSYHEPACTQPPGVAFLPQELTSSLNAQDSAYIKTCLLQASNASAPALRHNSLRSVSHESQAAKRAKLMFAAANLMSRVREQTVELKIAKRK